MIQFVKDDAQKLVAEGSDLIPVLKENGWKEDKPEVKETPKKVSKKYGNR